MLNAAQLSQLVDPVIFRAQASSHASTSGFVDQAAYSVLSKLGVECNKTLSQNTWKQRSTTLKHWQWIDRQILSFFERYTDGVGLEVNAGLSTRFHRLSQSTDWPQFSWQVINDHDVNDLLEKIFPILDNHTRSVCKTPVYDWYQCVNWDDDKPKIVVCHENQTLKSWHEFEVLSSSIFKYLNKKTPTIDIVLSHQISDLEEKIAQSHYPLSIVSSCPNNTLHNNDKLGLLAKISGQFKTNNKIYTNHIIFYR
ncbi:hypothetical protein [Agarilytica rhodophyticola]|uniref:hypothetical protein n=1 Tax=Agarilytica rhodophyticola TaxID=1737490 RepID=UPI000B34338C|nr:hypothetical protein [Agarilytica rhodophyticola]